ncbi:type II toxin-antitoxin system VapC family toxin [Nocardia brasiliensis]|uniref:Ribonuclease VapC n=1 Tax=Nocardia brasiliensis (strain ATCC 700358 / HUJEG-1) TaxID=1133849 RepID=K0F4A5_NOCB7|nr:type II toxin-antitoxin system VapC family toxin [Nocardia brasiliensis]AFU04015.1 Putative plasmid stability-like protein [Nocardia brasiliensis ATCC 700358]OCF91201.1 recombinase [Nocardia brasiliensis]
MKNYVLDTCAVSEWMKPQPDPGLIRWLHTADEDRLHLSVITLGEIRKGIEKLPDSPKRQRLVEWLTESLLTRFGRRILPVDAVVAQAWGRLAARLEQGGTSVESADVLIAATAESHGFTVVTRNVKHFEPTGVSLVCPWGE